MSLDLPVIETTPAPKPPGTLVVRLGHMRVIAELPYDGDVRPGCGAKVVYRTARGTEIGEILTTTCSNGGCAKSITRDKLHEYIENSGGDDYPFTTEGRVVRVATPEDLKRQKELEASKGEYVALCKQLIRDLDLPMKLVEVELLLGGEMATFYFMSEHRVDFRALVKQLAARFRTRIQMHQVGARDEARLVADYETCGQHCCCKQFLKVLKPISMGAAKMQKATLDPNKISGRCGRLKCCLRYEEQTYEELRRQLPRVGSRVRTGEGAGFVIETMILTQLVKVRLDNDRILAVANEELLERDLKESPAARDRRPTTEDRLGDAKEQRGPRAGAPGKPGPRPMNIDQPPRKPDARPSIASEVPPVLAKGPEEVPESPRDVPAVTSDAQEPHSKPIAPEPASPVAQEDGTSVPHAPEIEIRPPAPPEQKPPQPQGIGMLGRVRRGRSRGRGPGGQG